MGLAVHTSLRSIVLLGTQRIFQRPNTKFSSASSLLPLLRPDCRLNIRMACILIKVKRQRSPGSSQHAVEATPDLLDGFVAARQHGRLIDTANKLKMAWVCLSFDASHIQGIEVCDNDRAAIPSSIKNAFANWALYTSSDSIPRVQKEFLV